MADEMGAGNGSIEKRIQNFSGKIFWDDHLG